jgi:exopolyphosphatase/guanosine-5'-triphosphate,3'-diphosphate pyrophosphatase
MEPEKGSPEGHDAVSDDEATIQGDLPADDAPVRICVVDLGTNSFHAVVVDVHADGTFESVDRLKEMVHLGEGTSLGGGRLTEDAMDRGFEALRRIQLLARSWEVREFVTCATSALREAENGGAFIERVRRELGLIVRPVSGEREAELIYRGVRHAVDLAEPALVADIGGGSVECVVGGRAEAHFAESLKLGAARMTARFGKSDPLSGADAEALRAHYREALGSVRAACREQGVRRLVGTSGTMESLAAVCAHRQGRGPTDIFQQTYPAEAFAEAARWVAQASEAERRACKQIEDRRVAQIPAGAVLAQELIGALPEAREVCVSPYALREGLVVDFIAERRARLRRLAPLGDVRRRSVVERGMRFGWDEAHARHVAGSALRLFDVARPLMPAGEKETEADRELLEYAALLHDVGYHISPREHEKHSQYLIEHSRLHGFREREVRLLALVARYHRGPVPSDDHTAFAALEEGDRARVRRLAALLRLAEALDRSHLQSLETLHATLTDEALCLSLESDADDLRLERWAVQQSHALFEEVFERAVRVEA